MLDLLKSRVVLTALGLLLLAVLIWFVGPYFAFADVKPLESVVGRLVAILIIVIAYAVYVQVQQVRNARSNRRLADEVSKQVDGDDTASDRTASGDAVQLRKRFEEAIETLKRTKRRGAANLYNL